MGGAPDAVVWVADDQVAAGLDYGVRLIERLRDRGLQVERADLTSVDGHVTPARLHVISGGGTSVNDRAGWMDYGLRATDLLVEQAHQGRHAVLGVCLGAQMIAETLWPGSVRRGERIEVGLVEVDWRPTAEFDAARLVVPAFHYEEIDRGHAVKGGGKVIALDQRNGLQGFGFGERLWGVQFHPELDPVDLRRLIAHHLRTIEAHHTSAAAALESVAALEPVWNRAVFDQVLDHVTAIVR
jgi:GMP synthase-like glutamine amidotransferase